MPRISLRIELAVDLTRRGHTLVFIAMHAAEHDDGLARFTAPGDEHWQLEHRASRQWRDVQHHGRLAGDGKLVRVEPGRHRSVVLACERRCAARRDRIAQWRHHTRRMHEAGSFDPASSLGKWMNAIAVNSGCRIYDCSAAASQEERFVIGECAVSSPHPAPASTPSHQPE